jgi:hypothetical protein
LNHAIIPGFRNCESLDMVLERRALNDILEETPALGVHGDWLCINIETDTAWPAEPQPFSMEGHSLWLMPHSTENYPGIAINRPSNLDRDSAWALLHRALSLIAWTQDAGAMVVHMSGGNLPRMMGKGETSSIVIRRSFDLTDLPQVQDQNGRLALALMREGRGLNHPAYGFLSFYKTLEAAIPEGRTRGRWVSDNIDTISGGRAKEALKSLRESVQGDIGEHLLESGRHAIAHAKSNPIINPDDPRDAERLRKELPIIEALAVLAIEQRLGVQTTATVWREHLYELRGWKSIFGDELIAGILAGDPTEGDEPVLPPILNVRLRRSPPYAPFERMNPLKAHFGSGRVDVVYRSADGLVDLIFGLNFIAERIEFDCDKSIVARDDGSAAAARNLQALERFFRDYFGNGELQMWNADTGALVSRCDAYMPVNCFLDIDAANAAIDERGNEVAKREQLEAEQ